MRTTRRVAMRSAPRTLPANVEMTDAESGKIEAALAEAIAAAERSDATAYLKSFDDDALLAEMNPGQPPIVGKKALRPWIADFLENHRFQWSDYKSEEILLNGSLAFHRYTGTATFAPKAGGDTMRLRRRYMDILRRDSKGNWKIWHHVWTPACE